MTLKKYVTGEILYAADLNADTTEFLKTRLETAVLGSINLNNVVRNSSVLAGSSNYVALSGSGYMATGSFLEGWTSAVNLGSKITFSVSSTAGTHVVGSGVSGGVLWGSSNVASNGYNHVGTLTLNYEFGDNNYFPGSSFIRFYLNMSNSYNEAHGTGTCALQYGGVGLDSGGDALSGTYYLLFSGNKQNIMIWKDGTYLNNVSITGSTSGKLMMYSYAHDDGQTFISQTMGSLWVGGNQFPASGSYANTICFRDSSPTGSISDALLYAKFREHSLPYGSVTYTDYVSLNDGVNWETMTEKTLNKAVGTNNGSLMIKRVYSMHSGSVGKFSFNDLAYVHY